MEGSGFDCWCCDCHTRYWTLEIINVMAHESLSLVMSWHDLLTRVPLTIYLLNFFSLLSDYLYPFESCIYLSCRISNTQNAITRNARLKCRECINGLILLSYQSVGSVLIAVCSKRMSRHTESYQTLCDRQNKGAWRAFVLFIGKPGTVFKEE